MLADWASELRATPGVDLDVGAGGVLDLAWVAAHDVARPAARWRRSSSATPPGRGGGGDAVRELSASARELAGWAGFGNRPVRVEFRRDGTSEWVVKARLTTAADGRFTSATRIPADAAGSWRVRFAGGPLNAPSVSAADHVAAG